VDNYEERMRTFGRMLLKELDVMDRLVAEAGNQDVGAWWYELRNEVKPVYEWLARYGKTPPTLIGDVFDNEDTSPGSDF